MLGGLAAGCLLVGTKNLVAAHADALRLSHIPHAPSTEYSRAARGMSDLVALLVSSGSVFCLMVAGWCLFRGDIRRGKGALTLAFFGACFDWLDAHLVRTSRWLAGYFSCGGVPQTAQEEARRAFAFAGTAAVALLAALAWLQIRDDHVL